jgi:glutaredoxin
MRKLALTAVVGTLLLCFAGTLAAQTILLVDVTKSEEWNINLGRMPVGSAAVFQIRIQNLTPAELRVTQVRVSDESVLQFNIVNPVATPDDDAIILVQVNAGAAEMIKEFIFITSTDRKIPLTKINILAKIDKEIQLPNALFFFKKDKQLEDVVAKLKEFIAATGNKVQIRDFDASVAETFKYLGIYEQKYQLAKGGPLELFVGDTAVVGFKDIMETVDKWIKNGPPKGAIPTAAPKAPISAKLFYQPGCKKCDDARELVKGLVKSDFPEWVKLEEIDLTQKEGGESLAKLKQEMGIKVEAHPYIFIGKSCLNGEDIKVLDLRTTINTALTPPADESNKASSENYQSEIQKVEPVKK